MKLFGEQNFLLNVTLENESNAAYGRRHRKETRKLPSTLSVYLFCWCFFLLLLARVVSRKKETTQMPEDDFSALHFRPNWNFQQQLLPQNSLRLLQSHQTSTWNAKPTDKSRLPIFILFCDSRKSVHLTATGKICGFHDKNFTSTIRGTTKRESRRSVPNYFFPSALDDWNSKTPRRKTSLVSCSGWWWIPSIVRKRKY